MVRRYRRKRLKDTSKRFLIIRADKRERFLVYSYIRGEFILPEDKDPRGIKLSINNVRPGNYFDDGMLRLLSEVNWFELESTSEDGTTYVYKNAPSKKFMRILMKINKLKLKKGILYFYTPLVFLAWLTAPTTIYNKENKTVSLKVNRLDELEDIRDWFYYGNLEEVTGNLEAHYEILTTIDKDNSRIIIDEDNIIKMIRYSSMDKYVHEFSYELAEFVRKELDIDGEKESWGILREDCRRNSGEREEELACRKAKRVRQVLRRRDKKQSGVSRKNKRRPGNKGKAHRKVHPDSE